MKKTLIKIYGNIATSLKKEYGIEFEREEIIIKILENLEIIIEEQFN